MTNNAVSRVSRKITTVARVFRKITPAARVFRKITPTLKGCVTRLHPPKDA